MMRGGSDTRARAGHGRAEQAQRAPSSMPLTAALNVEEAEKVAKLVLFADADNNGGVSVIELQQCIAGARAALAAGRPAFGERRMAEARKMMKLAEEAKEACAAFTSAQPSKVDFSREEVLQVVQEMRRSKEKMNRQLGRSNRSSFGAAGDRSEDASDEEDKEEEEEDDFMIGQSAHVAGESRSALISRLADSIATGAQPQVETTPVPVLHPVHSPLRMQSQEQQQQQGDDGRLPPSSSSPETRRSPVLRSELPLPDGQIRELRSTNTMPNSLQSSESPVGPRIHTPPPLRYDLQETDNQLREIGRKYAAMDSVPAGKQTETMIAMRNDLQDAHRQLRELRSQYAVLDAELTTTKARAVNADEIREAARAEVQKETQETVALQTRLIQSMEQQRDTALDKARQLEREVTLLRNHYRNAVLEGMHWKQVAQERMIKDIAPPGQSELHALSPALANDPHHAVVMQNRHLQHLERQRNDAAAYARRMEQQFAGYRDGASAADAAVLAGTGAAGVAHLRNLNRLVDVQTTTSPATATAAGGRPPLPLPPHPAMGGVGDMGGNGVAALDPGHVGVRHNRNSNNTGAVEFAPTDPTPALALQNRMLEQQRDDAVEQTLKLQRELSRVRLQQHDEAVLHRTRSPGAADTGAVTANTERSRTLSPGGVDATGSNTSAVHQSAASPVTPSGSATQLSAGMTPLSEHSGLGDLFVQERSQAAAAPPSQAAIVELEQPSSRKVRVAESGRGQRHWSSYGKSSLTRYPVSHVSAVTNATSGNGGIPSGGSRMVGPGAVPSSSPWASSASPARRFATRHVAARFATQDDALWTARGYLTQAVAGLQPASPSTRVVDPPGPPHSIRHVTEFERQRVQTANLVSEYNASAAEESAPSYQPTSTLLQNWFASHGGGGGIQVAGA